MASEIINVPLERLFDRRYGSDQIIIEMRNPHAYYKVVGYIVTSSIKLNGGEIVSIPGIKVIFPLERDGEKYFIITSEICNKCEKCYGMTVRQGGACMNCLYDSTKTKWWNDKKGYPVKSINTNV